MSKRKLTFIWTILVCWASTSSATGSCLKKRSSLSWSRPVAGQVQLNCVTGRWCQATPGQDGDEMARHRLPGQDGCHQVLEGGGGVPGPPTDLTATHVISFFWGNWQRKCTTIYHANIKMWLLWRGKLELSLARSQKWWYSSPSWTWRRGWPSWLGWKASIFRPEGKLWRHKAMKYAIH